MKANGFHLSEPAMLELAANHETPFAVVSLRQVRDNYALFRARLPRVRVHYAMKANPATRILTTMAQLGANFDVASSGEMEMLAALGIGGERMIYANPVKTPVGLRTAARHKVKRMTFDAADEIGKMARATPNAEVLLRIRVKNPAALVDLNAKFGAEPSQALELLRQARDAGLRVVGLAFHVGSQTTDTAPYLDALATCRRLFDEAAASGLALTALDIGGGVPIPALNGDDHAAAVMDAVNAELDRLFPDTELLAEPGRFMCGTAVNLVTSVIGVKDRDGQTWYTIDEGVYGAFSGSMYDHWTYGVESYKAGERVPVTLTGPSCDSIDVVRRDLMLPRLALGDLLLVPNAGAYTTASATTFNGFPLATIIYLDD